MNEVLIQKKISIERCVLQIRSYYGMATEKSFEEDFLKQDAIAMNLQRACECAIDMANYMVRIRKLGLPRNSGDSFDLIYRDSIIDVKTRDLMIAMVGFRNVLVHDYQKVNLSIIKEITETRLDDLIGFADQVLHADSGQNLQ